MRGVSNRKWREYVVVLASADPFSSPESGKSGLDHIQAYGLE